MKLIIELGKRVLTGYPFRITGRGWKNLVEAAQDFIPTAALVPVQPDPPLKHWKSGGGFTNTDHSIPSYQKCLQIFQILT